MAKNSMGKKIIFYVEGTGGIVITDLEDKSTLSETGENISKILSSNRVMSFQTENDVFLCKPTELRAVLVQEISGEKKQSRKGIKKRNEDPSPVVSESIEPHRIEESKEEI